MVEKKDLHLFYRENKLIDWENHSLLEGLSNLLKRVGEPPAVIDTVKTRKSTEKLQAYYGSKGYFNSTANYTIVPTKKEKRAKINYSVTKGKPYLIDSLSFKVLSQDLDSLYNLHKVNSIVKQKQQFDLENFNAERRRLTSLFRNSGVYNFQESSISYDILRDTTKIANDQSLDVEMNIANLPASNGNPEGLEYAVHRFEKINIFADYAFDTVLDSLSSVDYEGYTIWYQDELKYRPKALTDAIFFEKDSVYSDLNRTRHLDRLRT